MRTPIQDSITGRMCICFNETGTGTKSVRRILVNEHSEVFDQCTAHRIRQICSQAGKGAANSTGGDLDRKAESGSRSKSNGTKMGQARRPS